MGQSEGPVRQIALSLLMFFHENIEIFNLIQLSKMVTIKSSWARRSQIMRIAHLVAERPRILLSTLLRVSNGRSAI